MRHPLTFAVTVALIAPAAHAQVTGTVQDIVVVGTTDVLSNYLKATLPTQPGVPLSTVNLRQVEQDVLTSGYFRAASAELRTIDGKDVLYVTVVPNATISAVEASGFGFLPGDQFKKSIEELLNIAPGATLNTQRIEQAKEALATNYRQQGFPFVPSISSDVKTNPDGTATVVFVVDETAPVSRIEIEGVSLIPHATVANIFKPIYDAKKFTTPAFLTAIEALSQAYSDAGFIQAGVDTGNMSLQNGVLKVKVIEAKITAVDLSPLGEVKNVPGLQTQPGQPLVLSRLQADVRTLANLTGQAVGFALQPDENDPGRVTVLFGAADVETGPVKSVVFTGNTKVSSAALAAALKTRTGDIYSPQLAQDDFVALREVYRKAGYEISTRDAISFKDGVLTYNIREVRLAGYELAWQGDHKTKDRVILRELPTPGDIFNAKDTQEALGNISRLGYVTITGVTTKVDPKNPEDITYVIQLTEGKSGIPVDLGLTYDSLVGGWGGSAGYTNNNVGGLGHSLNFQIGATQNQAGQNWTGNLSYTIPWLDFKFLDFQTKRTSLTASVGTNVAGNIALVDDNKVDTAYDYTVRSTGFGVSLGRNITPNLRASVGASYNYRTYFLEPLQEADKPTVTQNQAAALLSPNGGTARIDGSLNYDNTDNAEFPGRGVRASGAIGYNFGKTGDLALNWTDAEVGASTYYGFGKKVSRSFGVETYSNALAARVNYGTSFGNAPDGTGYYIGGSNMLASRELRGIKDGELFGTSYLTSSVEYRHDFGLSGGVAQGLYGVVFADYGTVWNKGSAAQSALGLGAGVQLNLGLGGARLPSLRFDYAFNPLSGTATQGKFHFRIGNFW